MQRADGLRRRSAAGRVPDFAQELHRRWETPEGPVAVRREEDLAACARLGAAALHFGLPEAVYRQDEAGHHFYASEEAIFGPIHPDDEPIVGALTDALREVGLSGAHLCAPLALGGHVDHRILRAAAEALGAPLWYYRDLPYAMRGGEVPHGLRYPRGVELIRPLEEEDVAAWIEAAACYLSQRSTFWGDAQSLVADLTAFLARERRNPHSGPFCWPLTMGENFGASGRKTVVWEEEHMFPSTAVTGQSCPLVLLSWPDWDLQRLRADSQFFFNLCQ